MNSFTVWEGTRVNLKATQGDSESVSASLVWINQDTLVSDSVTAEWEEVAGEIVADLSITAPDAGVYDYYVMENFETGEPIVYPSPSNCDGGQCELPTMTVCALEDGTS